MRIVFEYRFTRSGADIMASVPLPLDLGDAYSPIIEKASVGPFDYKQAAEAFKLSLLNRFNSYISYNKQKGYFINVDLRHFDGDKEQFFNNIKEHLNLLK